MINMDVALEILTVSGVAAVGGGFLVRTLVKSGIEEAVKLNFSRHLEDYKSELSSELEKLKVSLRNSETFFSHQLAALTDLRSLFRRIMPKKSLPDMDWHEACEEMAHSFSKHAGAIGEFLCKHEAVLPSDVIKKLDSAASIATDGTFEFTWNRHDGLETTKDAPDMANEMWHLIKESVNLLQTAVDAQVDRRGV